MSGVSPSTTLAWKAWGIVNLDGPPRTRPLRRDEPRTSPVLVADMIEADVVGPTVRRLSPRMYLSRVEAEVERDRMAVEWPNSRYVVVEFAGSLVTS
jgi:hypothetical protein